MARREVFKVPLHLGLVSSKGPEENELGELRNATGVYYKPGDDIRLHKLPGRVQLHSSGMQATSGTVAGLYLAQFDNGTDYLLGTAYGGYYFREADPAQDEQFALLSGIGATALSGTLHGVHYQDRHYLVTDGQQNLTVERSGSTLATRRMGMEKPLPFQDTDLINTSSGVNQTGASAEGTYDYPERAIDTGEHRDVTHALSNLGLNETREIVVSGFAEIPGGSILNIVHSIERYNDTGGFTGLFLSLINKVNAQFQSRVKIDFDYGNGYGSIPDGGEAFGWLSSTTYTTTRTKGTYQVPIHTTLPANDLRIRFTHWTFGSAFGSSTWTHRLFDTSVTLSGATGGVGNPNKPAFTASGLVYGYAEYDSQRGLQGPARWMEDSITLSGLGAAEETTYNSVKWVLPSGGPVNPNADTYIIYRTGQLGVPPADLGEVGQIPIPSNKSTQPIFVDQFIDFDENTQPTPLYEVLEVTQPDGTSLPFDLHEPPPPADFITVFNDSVCLIPQNLPRTLRYSEPGLPESFPLIYEISNFSLKENDQLVAMVPLNRVMIILMKEAVVRLTDLPFVSEETYAQADASPLDGVPGCVGKYAATALSMTGEPAAAWVSRHGIYLCDGAIAGSITEDIDWSATVSKVDLSTSVLRWDQERDMLIFAYDSDGDGVNDRYLLGHLNERHIKGTVFGRFPLPKWTGPHYGNIECLVEGEVSDIYRMYTGHPSDGQVYVEWSGVVDESLAASGIYPGADANVVPMDVSTGKMFTPDYTEFKVFKFSLRHSDWGADESLSATMVFKRDQNIQTSGVVTKTVALNQARGTEFFFGRQCETLEVQLQHTTSGTGSVTDMRAVTRKAGPAGNR